MQITLVNYESTRINFNLKDKPINSIKIRVVSGDEIAIITYTDNRTDVFDSDIKEERKVDYFDGEYYLWSDLIDTFSQLKGASYDRYNAIKNIMKEQKGIR